VALKPILMPQLGLTMEEGTFQGFLKGVGEAFRKGEPFSRWKPTRPW
jgi:pyruvate/2-oxoglutarate dehydrogenase complex dihydrolipoamide acyltransferase (E2) component